MTHVLFVCTGNICRSAFAERYARALRTDVAFSSAGTGAVVGAPIDPGMVFELGARGGDATGFAARQLDGEMIRSADLILTMESYHRGWILDDFPTAVRRTLTLGQAVRALEELPTGTDLLTHLVGHRHRPRRRDDVVDPYRRGEAAMATAAAMIGEALDRLVPTLPH